MKGLSPWLIVCLILCLSSTGCSEYEALEQQKTCKKRADSLYRAHRDSLVINYDSICSAHQNTYYKAAIDSLTKTRIDDIINLIQN